MSVGIQIQRPQIIPPEIQKEGGESSKPSFELGWMDRIFLSLTYPMALIAFYFFFKVQTL